jgi:hypothetical protein
LLTADVRKIRARSRLVEQWGVPDQLAMLVQLALFDPPGSGAGRRWDSIATFRSSGS